MSHDAAPSTVARLLDGAAAARLPLSEATSLPPELFTNEDWFDAERRTAFASNWIAVARSSEVAEPKSYVTDSIVGEPVVVVRDRDGALRAFSNVCRHRSLTMLEGSGSAASLQCPYHLWTYRLDGSLAGAPAMDDGFDKGDVCLPEFAVCEWHGWVFVDLSGTAAPIASQAPTLDAVLADEQVVDMVHVGSLSYPSPWNWKVSIENFQESYHHRGVHPDTLDATYPGFESFASESGDEPWSAVDHVSVVDGMDPFVAAVLFPTHAFALLRGVGMTWFKFQPLTATTTQLDIEIFTRPELAELGDTLVEATREINDEDVPINERTFEGLQSAFASAGPVSPLEAACWKFRRWLLDTVETSVSVDRVDR